MRRWRLLGTAGLVVGMAASCTPPSDAIDAGGADTGVTDADMTDGPPPFYECSRPPCPVPALGMISVCGRIFDIETSLPIDADANDMDTGPASHVEVRLYDPLGLPSTPLVIVKPDTCGYYVARDVPPPFNGAIAVAVDDDADDGLEDYWLTAVATSQTAGQTISDFATFATRRSTDCLWSTMAMPPGFVDCASTPDMTFAARGVYLPIFLDPTMPPVGPFSGTPAAGVQITQGNASDGNKDFYFTDMDPLTRSVASATQDMTGTNGAGLWLDGLLVDFSGTGGEPAGCMWPSNLMVAPAGLVFVQERYAAGGPCSM